MSAVVATRASGQDQMWACVRATSLRPRKERGLGGSSGASWEGLLGPPSTRCLEGRVAKGTGTQGAAARASGEAGSGQRPRSFVADVSWAERGHQKSVCA